MEKLTIFGLPLNPLAALEELAGASFCVSYAHRKKLKRQLDDAIRLVGADGMLLLDNGAFTLYGLGESTCSESYVDGFEAWANAILARCPQAVAVIPDVIGGTEAENADMVRWSLLPRDRSMGVWHTNESLAYLIWLCETLGHVAIGSAGEHFDLGPTWHARIGEALAAIDAWEAEPGAGNVRPRIHMMRAQKMAHLYPFDSSDSTNVARNHGRYRGEPGHVGKFAARIDAKIQASAGAPAPHQVARPLLEHLEPGDAPLYELATWFHDNYRIERAQGDLFAAAA